MNVLMLSGDVVTAQGATGVFHETLRHLSPHWGRIDVVCPATPGAAPRVVHGNAHVHPVGGPRVLQALAVARRGRDLFAERHYDLIVSHDYSIFANGIAAWWLARRHGVPYVSEMHHIEGYPVAASRREAAYRLLAGLYARFAARYAAAIRTVNADEVPEWLVRHGVPARKIRVLPSLYLDLEVFAPWPETPREWDVLCVGRLVENKNFGNVIEAVERCRRAGRRIRLCILGEGPLETALRRRVHELGLDEQVSVIASVPGVADVARVYRSAAMLVCSSTSEGGPRVTVEAMACGTPVLTTRVGIMRQLVVDGVNACFVDAHPEALATAIVRVLDDEPLRERLGVAGRQTAMQFGADAVVGALVAEYHAIARRARRERPTSLP